MYKDRNDVDDLAIVLRELDIRISTIRPGISDGIYFGHK